MDTTWHLLTWVLWTAGILWTLSTFAMMVVGALWAPVREGWRALRRLFSDPDDSHV